MNKEPLLVPYQKESLGLVARLSMHTASKACKNVNFPCFAID
jgi:hypothetical protein